MPGTIKYLMYLTTFPWPLHPESGEGLSMQGELRYQRTWPAAVLLEFQLLAPISSQRYWKRFSEPQNPCWSDIGSCSTSHSFVLPTATMPGPTPIAVLYYGPVSARCIGSA